MSSRYYNYVGPFVRCKTNLSKSDAWKLSEKMRGRLFIENNEDNDHFPEGYDYWSPNVKLSGSKRKSSFDNEGVFAEVTPEMIAEEIETFNSQFASSIEILEDNYEEVTVLWGYMSRLR